MKQASHFSHEKLVGGAAIIEICETIEMDEMGEMDEMDEMGV